MEPGFIGTEKETQRANTRFVRDFAGVVGCVERVGADVNAAKRAFMRPEVHCWTHQDFDWMRSLEGIRDMCGVVPMHQVKPLFELRIAPRECPDRQTGTQAELRKILRPMQFGSA